MECDYCGEYCAQLGVEQPAPFTDDGWIPSSSIEQHRNIVGRIVDCSIREDDGYVPSHVGPWHARDGRPLEACRHCTSRAWMMVDGYWDTSLDHNECPDCWGEVAGGNVLERIRRRAKVAPLGRPAPTPVPDTQPVSTEPADRERVSAAFRAYLGGDRLPIRWVGSPVGVVEALDAALQSHELDTRAGDGPGWSIRASSEHWGITQFRSTRRIRPGAAVATVAPQDRVSMAIEAAILADHPDLGEEVDAIVDAGSFESVDPDWATPPDDLTWLLAELRASCGPLVVLADEIVASDRPLVLRLDDQGRLHDEDGPAIAYPDGFTVHAWHGVTVPAPVILDAQAMTIESIDVEPNAEVRRVMVERFGVERLIREGGATMIHEDEMGRLWRRQVGTGSDGRGRDEPVAMVEVLNSTPEPDGSRKTYFLRVPPTVTTAREAVAWTFGMDRSTYAPTTET